MIAPKVYLLFVITQIFNSLSIQASTSSQSSSSSYIKTNPLVLGVDGGTESIRACCFDATDGKIVGKPCAVSYKTSHPKPGWAEQNPADWYSNLIQAVRGALKSVDEINSDDTDGIPAKSRVRAICIDTTCCSVVALDHKYEPLRPSLLWMDSRSAPQTKLIFEKCEGDPALQINCDGQGPLSAEWMTPKALWVKQNEPEIWSQATTICEYQDYINYKLTGVLCASSCNAAARWHWDGAQCTQPCDMEAESDEHKYPGRPISLYEKLGIRELAEKLPSKCLSMGDVVGRLTKEAAENLGLTEDLLVVQGGPDAFVGMIGLGCIHPGQLCLITGSSHLHCVVTSKPTTSPGTWGAYKGAPLPNINFAEGGQSSTGSIIRWAKNLFNGGKDDGLDYATLDNEASLISPGSDGLIALETFQGSRTPVTDPLARGALLGLTLSHSRSHIWRSLMEAVCFGTRACVDSLSEAGHECGEIIIAGGTTRSPLWLQMHADVTGKPVVLCENIDAPLLGCAILASVGAKIHNSVEDAVNNMVRISKHVEPNEETAKEYDKIYEHVYKKVSLAVRPVVHSIAKLRGGHSADLENDTKLTHSSSSSVTISPSLLASDWAKIGSEVERCVEANLLHIHIDVFDGVFLDSPYALTFGPKMVKSIRSVSDSTTLDIHLCVDRPSRYISSMAESGASRVIFQWEAMKSDSEGSQLEHAIKLAKSINDHGLKCGVSINPETDVSDLFPLIESSLVDLVDILAVEPGFGGQSFQYLSLEKIQTLRNWINRNNLNYVKIMIDGGINDETSVLAKEAGADILVAGTYLFRHDSLSHAASKIL